MTNINPQLIGLRTPIAALHADPNNRRRHPQRSLDAIKQSLQKFGQQKPVVALEDGTVIAGNGTLAAAQALGWDALAVVCFSNAADARAYALADNRSAELSEWDPGGLAGELEADGLLDGLDALWTEEELNAVMGIHEDAPAKDPPAKEARPGPRKFEVLCGDSREVLARMPENTFDAVLTDPPYELGFMGRAWDKSGIAFNVDLWRAVLRVLKPGGVLLAFGGTRTAHRMVCAIEDAGFEVRDQIAWMYGTGFAKSMDVSLALDKSAGKKRADRTTSSSSNNIFSPVQRPEHRGTPVTDAAEDWDGYGTAIKPAYEPICVARKPLEGTVAENVLRWGTGALNIEGTRVDGRFPANTILDEAAGAMLEAQAGDAVQRFFYCPKPSRDERDAGLEASPATRGGVAAGLAAWGEKQRNIKNHHPTVKPADLGRYLATLIARPGARVLDPFCGSGGLGVGCVLAGVEFTGVELQEDHAALARARMAWWASRADIWAAPAAAPTPALQPNNETPKAPNPDNGHGAGDGAGGEDFPARAPYGCLTCMGVDGHFEGCPQYVPPPRTRAPRKKAPPPGVLAEHYKTPGFEGTGMPVQVYAIPTTPVDDLLRAAAGEPPPPVAPPPAWFVENYTTHVLEAAPPVPERPHPPARTLEGEGAPHVLLAEDPRAAHACAVLVQTLGQPDVQPQEWLRALQDEDVAVVWRNMVGEAAAKMPAGGQADLFFPGGETWDAFAVALDTLRSMRGDPGLGDLEVVLQTLLPETLLDKPLGEG